MNRPLKPALEQEQAWLVLVPKRQEFNQPPFHFGERVKWAERDASNQHVFQTGRLLGLLFQEDTEEWIGLIRLDVAEISDAPAWKPLVVHPCQSLKLVSDSTVIRDQLQTKSVWMMTKDAAAALGLSPEQLRRLRRKELFKAGVHCRDTSVPGSGIARWQWHVERCSKAIAIPPDQRPMPRA